MVDKLKLCYRDTSKDKMFADAHGNFESYLATLFCIVDIFIRKDKMINRLYVEQRFCIIPIQEILNLVIYDISI